MAELKGYCQTLPDAELLLNAVILQERKDSSAIENIVITPDELYQAILNPFDALPANSMEVIGYRQAIKAGWSQIQKKELFTSKLAVPIVQSFKHTNAVYRKTTGTKLKSPVTKQIIYSLPDPQFVEDKSAAWEKYLNEATAQTDPLIGMALMHYQFEAVPSLFRRKRAHRPYIERVISITYRLIETAYFIPSQVHQST